MILTVHSPRLCHVSIPARPSSATLADHALAAVASNCSRGKPRPPTHESRNRRADPGRLAGHPADHHRPVPAGPADVDHRSGRRHDAGPAHTDRPAAGLWPVAIGLGTAIGPIRPPSDSAARAERLYRGRHRIGHGADDGPIGHLAHAARRGHGRRRDGGARHHPRPVRPCR